MCAICDGKSQSEFLATLKNRIEVHGFTMVSVGDDHGSWTYTIGLTNTFDHPELVVTGLAPESAYGLLDALVDRIRTGEQFGATSHERFVHGAPVRFGEVHQGQWHQGRFDSWKRVYSSAAAPPRQGAVQVVWPNDDWIYPPDPRFCMAHENSCQALLDVDPCRRGAL